MGINSSPRDNRTFENAGVRSLFDTEVNIKIRVLTIIALAGAVGNTLGFLANLFLYGFNFVTGFCALCALLIVLNLFFGLKSKHGVLLGYAMLALLDVLEFPLLTLTYGAVMYPYMLIGFHALSMIIDGRRRIVMCTVLGVYDLGVIVYSSLNPYIFGPQDSIGLMGSAIVTFAISLITVAALVIMWQNVYLVETVEIDPVTKAMSRVGFNKNAAKTLSHSDDDFVLLYFNICSFKAVNSIFGIDGGNRFLHYVADMLYNSPFSPRLVGRLNSDRFVCLAEKKKFDKSQLDKLCHVPYEEKGREITVLLNCGVYEIKDKSLPIPDMTDRAAIALRFIHSAGNKYYAIFDEKAEKLYREETGVLGEKDKAITTGQFRPFFQPIVDCNTLKVVSAEALARWIHPELGVISPAVFIPVLEKKDLISNLDRLIASRVSELIKTRTVANKRIVPVSVNLSRADLYDRDMMSDLHMMVQGDKNEDHWYRFEITESAYEDMSDVTLDTLAELRKSGAAILVDDFGSGYSSLGMITDYEFDIIKLDMQFARKLAGNEKVCGVVQSIIDMAHKLGAKVVAEGIETEEQFNAVKECGCDYIQGYFFYKPLPEKDFLALLDSQE